MKIDIKKVYKSPSDQWQAIEFMINAQFSLMDAIHIMQSILDNPDPEYWEFHEKRMKEFISKYTEE